MLSIDRNSVVILQFLGQGGQGPVFKGLLKRKEVAVKFQERLRIPKMQFVKRDEEQKLLKSCSNKKYFNYGKQIWVKIYETLMEIGSLNLRQFITSKKYQLCKMIEKIKMFYQANFNNTRLRTE